jgi:hypothetical protein
MKLTKNYSFVIINSIILLISINCILGLKAWTKNGPKTNPDPAANPSDAVYKRITDYISAIAEEKMKTSDIMAKKKIAGALPEGYPKEVIQKALETRNDRKKWRQVMGLPTELHRMCLYPFARINYVKWCNNSYFGMKTKAESKSRK